MIYQLIIYLFVNSFIHSFIHFSCDASGRRVGAEWPADQRDVYGRHRQTGLRRHRFRLPVGGCLHDGCRPRHQTRPGFRQDVPIAADQSKGRDHRNGTGEQQREDLKLFFTRSFHGARFFIVSTIGHTLMLMKYQPPLFTNLPIWSTNFVIPYDKVCIWM